MAGEASAAAADVDLAPPVPDPAAAAFFDVDNTLMRGASIYYFARGLAARKMFGPRDLTRLAWSQVAFRLRGMENADHIDAAREAALAFVAGQRVDDIVSLGEEIYEETMADRIWDRCEGTHPAASAGRSASLAGNRDTCRTGEHPGQAARAYRRARYRRGDR